MNNREEIDRLIKEAQLELSELENKQRQVLEKIRQLRIRRKNLTQSPADQSNIEPSVTDFSSQTEKISLFRSLFKGREDVFPKRWTSANGEKRGYSPYCKNEWVKGICDKSKVKCADCMHRVFVPISDNIIENHLKGIEIVNRSKRDFTIGIYPLLLDETCWLLAVDFDKKSWTEDALAFLETCDQFDIPAVLERSRSGNGAHIWIFFTNPIPARIARKLGTLLLTQAMDRRPEIGFKSFYRLFPSQDILPIGGFGNIIALHLQRKPRDENNSVFIDRNIVPFDDQWAYLSTINKVSLAAIENLLSQFPENDQLIGVKSVTADENKTDPWLEPPSRQKKVNKITGPLPDQVEIVLRNQIFIDKTSVPPSLLNRFIRIAAFQNPEFYKYQKLRLPTYNKPRIIHCFDDFPGFIGLPRGCIEELVYLLESHNIKSHIIDERFSGMPIDVDFHGKLEKRQDEAAIEMLQHETGVLSVPTGFGKTVIAIYMLAKRSVNSLILVHRKELQEQWVDRLSFFLNIDSGQIGRIGGGRKKPKGFIDVALIQSLNRKGLVNDIVENYGHLIVDECHHLSAFSFERVARECKAKYVTGLSATPTRKDGHHPIIFMTCGPIRHRVSEKNVATTRPFKHKVIVRNTAYVAAKELVDKESLMIHEIYADLISNHNRNDQIVEDVIRAIDNGRSPLVLTERRDHHELLYGMLSDKVQHIFALKGGMGKKQRKALFDSMHAVKPNEERVLVATGKYLGEGFDDARLDTLFLTLPISWKGTLIQYAGRLHRLYDGKSEVIIYDYADLSFPMLSRMYERRFKGYKSIGYEVKVDG